MIVGAGDLTTARAPFVDAARQRGELFLEQPYGLYSRANRADWQYRFESMRPLWAHMATARLRAAQAELDLRGDRVPCLGELNERLARLSRFRARAVAGELPAHAFFDCLHHAELPVGVTVPADDPAASVNLFRDAATVPPLLVDPSFAAAVASLGDICLRMAARANRILDFGERLHVLENNLRALYRVVWFTFEYGVSMERGQLRAYGRRLLVSPELLTAALGRDGSARPSPFQLERVVHQDFDAHSGRESGRWFYVESMTALVEHLHELGDWLDEGKVDSVCPGEPRLAGDELLGLLAAA